MVKVLSLDELDKLWEIAIRDDAFNKLVSSDVRCLIRDLSANAKRLVGNH
jgi:phosphate uptake regulator